MSGEVLFECRDVSKSFGGTRALKNVRLEILPGEVHSLLGENGAGKSTLMKLIMGLYRTDSGEMHFDGAPYVVHSPVEAIKKGISMIYQELNPEPYLTIAENIFLKREDNIRGTPFLDKKKTNMRADEILKQFNFPADPRTLMENLTIAQSQMVEIIKAVSCSSKMLIMDEPTSSLDSEETDHLFRTIRDLKSKGVAIIYISHRMEEIFEISDRVSVFRDGEYIGTRNVQDATKAEFISMMVGREIKNVFPKVDCPIGDVIFKVQGLSGKGFKDISFEVRSGEILGVSGLVGSGRSETMRAIFGLDPLEEGKIFLNGKELFIRKPRDAIRSGIAMVNEDRKLYGLVMNRSLRENISLPNLWNRQQGLFLNYFREGQEVKEISSRLTVKSSGIDAEAYSLSGGNQQKVVLSKWLMASPKVLILDEPTRGVDVGAKAEVHALMSQFAAHGMAIVMISSELPKVMGMSDRILIYHEGKTNGVIERGNILSGKTTQQDIIAKEFGQ
jgi:ribose transport system ATP-binding protein/inositol transport system ATP-binding protein